MKTLNSKHGFSLSECFIIYFLMLKIVSSTFINTIKNLGKFLHFINILNLKIHITVDIFNYLTWFINTFTKNINLNESNNFSYMIFFQTSTFAWNNEYCIICFLTCMLYYFDDIFYPFLKKYFIIINFSNILRILFDV